jgi:hypothetical protein
MTFLDFVIIFYFLTAVLVPVLAMKFTKWPKTHLVVFEIALPVLIVLIIELLFQYATGLSSQGPNQ